ncbi:MAG: AAA family ATPase [Verrucomicrobiaceae bacterium]|nr:AAA family ATPase [Verrucomicrobiaceae bacterium]
MKSLAPLPADYPRSTLPGRLTWVMKKTGKELAPPAQAVREALKHRMLIITGSSGVGKTTILRSILVILDSKGVKIVLAARLAVRRSASAESTGMEAKTITACSEFEAKASGAATAASRSSATSSSSMRPA